MDMNQYNRKRFLETQDNVAWRVPTIDRTEICHFYRPECVIFNPMVFKVSFAYARSEISDETVSACHFGSALCAICPYLTPVVIDALEDNGIKPFVITLPFDAANHGVNLNNNPSKYDPIKIYTILGSCIIVLFVNNVNVISDDFIRNTVYDLANKLRMPKDKISELGEEILPAQAKAIYNILGTQVLKKEVEVLLTQLSKGKDNMALMASFVLEWKNNFD